MNSIREFDLPGSLKSYHLSLLLKVFAVHSFRRLRLGQDPNNKIFTNSLNSKNPMPYSHFWKVTVPEDSSFVIFFYLFFPPLDSFFCHFRMNIYYYV